MENNSELIIYTTEDGLTKVDVTFQDDTVWLSIDQMAQLFQRDRSVIGKHIRNICEVHRILNIRASCFADLCDIS